MASPNTMSLHGNLSLFSCQGAEIYSHSAFSLLSWGSFAWTRNKTWNQEGEVLNLKKVSAQAENYDCTCGEWSEHLVIQNPAAAAKEFCTRRGQPVNEIML
jgi:hypothetical protein